MLNIQNLHATVADEPVLKGIGLSVNAVEAQKLLGISLEGSVG